MKDLRALFHQRRVLVVGDCMIDRYLYGAVDRISPEAPVPVLRRTEKEDRPGGAANVALNAVELGMEVGICSIHGRDKEGESLKEICYAAGIRHQFWTSSEHRPTTIKTRVIARQQHLLRVDYESTEALRADELDAFSLRMEDAFERFQPQIVILQDYNKGLFTPSSIKRVMEIAKARGCFIAVDPKKDNFSAFTGVDLFKPNLKEFRQATNWERPFNEKEISAIADAFITKVGAKNLFITLSEAGIYHRSENGTGGRVPTTARSIVDVCGAGDAVITVAAAALHAGLSPRETALICNIAGGQVCERVGVSPVRIEELEREYRSVTNK